jgi:ABC-2 type transport system ATP-binding protein
MEEQLDVSPMRPAIRMRGPSKRYRGVTALAELSLDVPAGSVVGFLGPNGAGKTTTLKILAGLTRADAGTASIDGMPVAGRRDRAWRRRADRIRTRGPVR